MRLVSYDTTLPAQHSYLGGDLEALPGRVIQDEDSTVTIPLLSIDGVILVPGQLLPMQLQHPSFVSMMAKIVATDRTFGLTSNSSTSGIGTTAEISSFSIENDSESGIPFVRMKAIGRQVFVIKEKWRGADSILMGRVTILSESRITHPFHRNCLSSIHGFQHNKRLLPAVTPHAMFVYQQYEPQDLMRRIMVHLENWASFERKSSCPTRATSTRAAAAAAPTPRLDPEYLLSPTTDDTATTSPSPSSSTGFAPPARVRRVVTKRVRMQDHAEESSSSEQDDEDNNDADHEDNDQDLDEGEAHDSDSDSLEFEQIPSPEELRRELMADSKMDKSCSFAPDTPIAFSYWVAANLPLEDKQRIQFLSLSCVVQRLRWLLSVLQRFMHIYCHNCGTKLCRKEDVFAMSTIGPQGTYVNAYGHVHETITVYRAESLALNDQTSPSTEFSWFPGYAWSICFCRTCGRHIGWKFTAACDKSLKPEFFWALARKAIELGFRTDNDSGDSTFRPVI